MSISKFVVIGTTLAQSGKFLVRLNSAGVAFPSLRIPDHFAKHPKCKEEYTLKLRIGPTFYWQSKLANCGGLLHLTYGWQDLVHAASLKAGYIQHFKVLSETN